MWQQLVSMQGHLPLTCTGSWCVCSASHAGPEGSQTCIYPTFVALLSILFHDELVWAFSICIKGLIKVLRLVRTGVEAQPFQ